MAQNKAMVIGLGASGEACAKFLLKRGYEVVATDTRAAPPGLARLAGESGFSFVGLERAREALTGVLFAMISPGISPYFSPAAPLCGELKRKGIELVGEIELFARELKRLKDEHGYAPKVIGVTGTNGKTTTTSLTAKMAAQGGLFTIAAGNIGPNAVTELDKALEAGRLPEVWVLELSSFQLETTHSLSCDSAAVLNVTQDHIDWHGSFEAYARAKSRIFVPGTVRVLNRGDQVSLAMSDKSAACLTFGTDAPQQEGGYGLIEKDGAVWLCVFENGKTRALLPVGSMKIRGRHNQMNALAALALISGAGLSEEAALDALKEYKGEPHRVEFVASIGGVDYFDDGKGTNVGAVAAALEGLGSEGRKIVIILGGDGKGQDFSGLRAPMDQYARAAFMIGRDGRKIADQISSGKYPIQFCKDLPEAVRAARDAAEKGDAVLLSPACASWDMFPNYVVRSKLFTDTVLSFKKGD